MKYQIIGIATGILALGFFIYFFGLDVDNHYVPFKVLATIDVLASDICNIPGKTSFLNIDGGSDFMVTGIILKPTGVDEVIDSIMIHSIQIDGRKIAMITHDLTGAHPTPYSFDIMGVPLILGGNLPTSIVALCADSQDIRIGISCGVGTTTDITFPEGSITVSGWKLASDTITAVYAGEKVL